MNRSDLQKLQQIKGYPALTITLPTHRTSPDNKQDPIRVKNLAIQAAERLLQEFTKSELEPLLARLDHLVESLDYQYMLDGLVLFVNRDMALAVQLPFSLTERTVVDETFYTRDLVFTMTRTQRYWTLVLSEKPTRLYECTRDDMIEIREGGFPLTHEGPGGEQALPGGFGVERSTYRDEQHRQFFRRVNSAFKPFMTGDPLPLVIVGVDRFLAFFDEVTSYKTDIIARLTGSHDKTSAHELGKLVWPLVESSLSDKRQQVFDELEKAVGERKYVSSVGEVWRLAKDGRGKLLLVERDFHYRASVDETGRFITPAEGATGQGVVEDAVDEIIEAVWEKQGEVVFVDNGQLAAHQRIALILRY